MIQSLALIIFEMLLDEATLKVELIVAWWRHVTFDKAKFS